MITKRSQEVLASYRVVLLKTTTAFKAVDFKIGLCLALMAFSQAQAQTDLPILPSTSFNYANVALPAHFRVANINRADTTPANNPISDAGATLGRVLFYDKRLSNNNTISCSSCHQQAHGFSDPDRLSTGFAGGLTQRHSMGLANARYYGPNRFFWDERAISLEAQVLEPIQDPVEMGMDLNTLVTKLSNTNYYGELFQAAFGSSTINADRISRALAQFVRSMVSYRSKFDAGVPINFSNFTAQEQTGRELFESNRTNCNDCHETSLQILDMANNNGLDAVTTDPGAGNATFKSPSLRNIAIRPPYMHDGRFNTLAEVVAFYNSGVQDHPNLALRLRNNMQPVRMNLSPAEQAALVAFLETLTDTDFLEDPAFSDPFTFNAVNVAPIVAPVIQFLLDGDDEG